MKDATVFANKIAQEENDKALARIKEMGKTQVHTLTVTERAELKKVMIKTHSEMASRIGKETIDAIYKETGFDPAKL
jgi:C4-dicarboxylate-binding protein DctP